MLRGQGQQDYTWNDVARRVARYRIVVRRLLTAADEPQGKVAFLMGNSLEMALLDLACLTSGVVNVMIPANARADQIQHILAETEATAVFVSGDGQLAELHETRQNLPRLHKVVLVHGQTAYNDVESLEALTKAATLLICLSIGAMVYSRGGIA